jgi:hypothetical protein
LQDAIDGEEDDEEEEEEEEAPAPSSGRQTHGQRRVGEIASTLHPSSPTVSSTVLKAPAWSSGTTLHKLQEPLKPSLPVTAPLLGTTSKVKIVRQWTVKTASGQGQCRTNPPSSYLLPASAAVH